MLVVDHSIKTLPTSWSTAVHLVRHSTISLHHAKEGYDYPIVRLPHTFSKLAGLPTKIYQTIHEGALAFLVVISPSNSVSENSAESPELAALTWRRSPVRIRPSPSFFLQSDTLQPSIQPFPERLFTMKQRNLL